MKRYRDISSPESTNRSLTSFIAKFDCLWLSAQIYIQILLHWSYLNYHKRRTCFEISCLLPQSLSVHISYEDYLLFVVIWTVYTALTSQPNALIGQQMLLRSHWQRHRICGRCTHEGNYLKQGMLPLYHKVNNRSNKGFVMTPQSKAMTNKQKD